MASIRFAGLVLGVIIVSLALKYSSACAHEGSERKGKWLPAIASQNHESPQNDVRDNVRKSLGGRKMKVHELLKREVEKKQGSKERLKISGKDDSKSLQGAELSRLNTQFDSLHDLNEASSKLGRGSHNGGSSSTALEEHGPHQINESQIVADEVVDLMRRDYKDFNRPRRNPPINNHEPTD